MPEIQCVFLEPLDMLRLSLRRYEVDSKCSLENGSGYHDASLPLADVEFQRGEIIDADFLKRREPTKPSCWPQHCACGVRFEDGVRQVFPEWLYMMPDGSTITLAQAPVGALWYHWQPHIIDFSSVHFLARHDRQKGHLFCRTPGGDWDIDQKSSNGQGWVRIGDPPDVTATPSILITGAKNYHGWLRAGKLTDC